MAATAAVKEPAIIADVARAYVDLALHLGKHDEAYVDAYYGPPEWHAHVEKDRPLDDIIVSAQHLRRRLDDASGADDAERMRVLFLKKQLDAMITHATALKPDSQRLSFDAESRLLYDAVAPTLDEATFHQTLAELDVLLPGQGPLIDRYAEFKRAYIIPHDRLSSVFDAAVAKTREITKRWIELPESESFRIEYVTDKPWSGYNWYKGDFYSVIQINTDLPIYIDRAIDLAAHEGYPGHHVYNLLLEKNLYRDRAMVEFCIYPLFSPQSLIAEGSANYGIQMCFPTEHERIEFERSILFPLAGLDPSTAERFYDVERLIHKLSYAGNEAARRFLNGETDHEHTVEWLTKFALMPIERARQRVKFFRTYRSYVISYNHGMDLVAKYVEQEASALANDTSSPHYHQPMAARWAVFQRLLSLPQVPSNLL